MRNNIITRNFTPLTSDPLAEAAYAEMAKSIMVVREHDPILDMIYVQDERTALPKGDLSVYLGANVAPEVRDYIQKNLMCSTSENLSTLDVDDDTLMLLTRGVDESRQSYVRRVNAYMKENIENEKIRLKYDKLIRDRK